MLQIIIEIFLLTVLVISTITDLKNRTIRNNITYPSFVILALLRVFEGEWIYFIGLVPALFFFLLYMIAPKGLGAGDIKLFAVIGLALGLEQTIGVLFWMSVGFLLSILFQKIRKTSVHSLPLAPFMLIGYLITFCLEVFV